MIPFKLSDNVEDSDVPLQRVTSPGQLDRAFSLNRSRKARSNSGDSRPEDITSAMSASAIDTSPELRSPRMDPHHEASVAPGSTFSARYNAPGAGIDAHGAPRSLGTLKESALSRHPTMN